MTTWIDAPMERCFRLSTNIDLHILSAAWTKESAVDGVRNGAIGMGETVTWEGRHFGLKLRHTSRINAWRPYSYFRDVMVDGVFTRFEHEHFFATMDDGTRMRDEIRFQAPYGPLGRVAGRMLVKRRLAELLARRNAVIKQVAESGEWQRFLKDGIGIPGDALAAKA